MRALSASQLLDVWERGSAQQPIQRALMLLAAACPETSPDALEKLSIGQRDARLLTLREQIYGPQLLSLATCPSCGERLELTFNVSDIRETSKAEPAEMLSLNVEGYKMAFRLPNSLDMGIIVDHRDVASTCQLLLEGCLIEASHNNREVSVEELPGEVLDMIAERMAQADPHADVQISLACPACKHNWQAQFDIVTFFWTEIDAWAHRILREVHILASAYGWRESDILAVSPWRRQFYLTMVNG